MPPRSGPVRRMEQLSPADRLRYVPGGCQQHWYAAMAYYLKADRSQTVLDVGCGTGYGLPILHSAGAARAVGIDPLVVYPGALPTPIEVVNPESYDWVTAMDVIEHVEDDVAFLGHLCRVARAGVFFSTPNWNHSKATNDFHLREYTPVELAALVAGRDCDFWASGYDRRPRRLAGPPAPGDETPNFAVGIWLRGRP